MTRPRNFPIGIAQGTSKAVTFCFSDAPDLTNAQIQLLVKRHHADTNYVLCKDIDINKSTNLEGGEFVVSFLPEDTADLLSRTYVYEVSVDIDPDKYVPIIGSFAIYDSIQSVG